MYFTLTTPNSTMLADAVMLAPGEESANRMQVRRSGVLVADGGGEEFQKAPGRVLAGGGDQHRHHHGGAGRDQGNTGGDDRQLPAGVGGLVNHDLV